MPVILAECVKLADYTVYVAYFDRAPLASRPTALWRPNGRSPAVSATNVFCRYSEHVQFSRLFVGSSLVASRRTPESDSTRRSSCVTSALVDGGVNRLVIGPIPWGHSGPLCHALSLLLLLLLSWTSHAACAIAIAGVRLATPGDWQCNGGSQ